MSKKGFIIPYGTAAQIGRLIKLAGAEEAVNLLEALEKYSMDGTEPENLSLGAEIIFEGMRKELDIDREKYEKTCDRNKKNRTANQSSPVVTSGDQSSPVGTDSRQKTEDSRQEIEIKDSNAGAEPLIGLPLNDGSEHPVTQEDFNEYAALYPAVDVMQELRDMRGWLLANPSRKKTKRGIKAFIRTWLSKEQDRPTARSGTKTTKQMTAEEILAIPTFNPWTEAAQ